MSVLLPTTTISTAVTAVVGSTVSCRAVDYSSALVEARFLYGAGGTTAKAWVQTRVSGGTWRDVINFAFTTAAAVKWSAVTGHVALAGSIVASDGALADDTILNGFFGTEFRLKYTTTGTYTGATSLAVDVVFRR